MASPVLLNNIDHKDLRVAVGQSAAFGDNVNQITVFPTEFEDLQREYPILFRRDPDGAYYSVVLLGLDRDENLFLDAQGWTGRYVPALLQRGPFSIGVPGRNAEGEPIGEPMIHVDLDHPRLQEGEGEPVFLPQGGNSRYLDHIAGVLQAIFIGSEVSRHVFAAFAEHDLIEPVTIEIKLEDDRLFKVPDCYTISQERLMQLDGTALAALHRADFLRAAIWVASSLRNLGRLADRKNARQAHA